MIVSAGLGLQATFASKGDGGSVESPAPGFNAEMGFFQVSDWQLDVEERLHDRDAGKKYLVLLSQELQVAAISTVLQVMEAAIYPLKEGTPDILIQNAKAVGACTVPNQLQFLEQLFLCFLKGRIQSLNDIGHKKTYEKTAYESAGKNSR